MRTEICKFKDEGTLTKQQLNIFTGWVQINFNEPEQIESLEELTVEEMINDFVTTIRNVLLHKKKIIEEAVVKAMKRSD